MNQQQQPVTQWYYSEQEWNRLGCGPLPPERDRANQLQDKTVQKNLTTDGKNVKGYN